MRENKRDKNTMRMNEKKIVNAKKRMFLIVGLAVLFMLLTIQNISAIGITPGRTSINFESGLNREVSFSIVNTEHKDMSVVFMVRGELADYITLSQVYEEFLSSDETKQFSYKIKLPAKFDKPGRYEGEIVALEMPKGIKEQGSYVGATVAVISQVHVYVPYPNKYVEAELNIIGAEGKTNFIIPVINRGKLDIVDLRAHIDVSTLSGERVVSLETNTISLTSLNRDELFAEWVPDVEPGTYKATATIIYDNEVAKIEKEFEVGEMLLEILEVYVKDFSLGEIAKFNALVENKWSEELKEVYLNILVYNNERETMADFKSPTYDIDALSKSEMVAYWDTAGVRQGTYDGKLMLKYGQRSTDRNIQLRITPDSIEIFGVTGRVLVTGKEGGTLNMNNLLLIIVGVLVIANIIWFVLIRRILKKRK
jgi:hypothetical protein